jgi:hypothetical protein
VSALRQPAARICAEPGTLDPVGTLLDVMSPQIVGRIDIPAHVERCRAIPDPFVTDGFGEQFAQLFPSGAKVWNHQGIGLEKVDWGEWRMTSYERSILLEPVVKGPPTAAIIHSQVGFLLQPAELIDGRYMSGEPGLLAKTSVRVIEEVIGYSVAGKSRFYSDLVKNDPRLRKQVRSFESTGVVLRSTHPSFTGSSDVKVARRKKVAEALRVMLAASHGIQVSEIGFAHTGVSQFSGGTPAKLDDALVLYDDVPGGLRLTEPLYSGFAEILDRLRIASARAGEDSMLDRETIDCLENWFNGLRKAFPKSPTEEVDRIYAPGSIVGALVNGQLQERKLLGHDLIDVGGRDMLMYRDQTGARASAWVASNALHPIGNDWSYLTPQQVAGGAQ